MTKFELDLLKEFSDDGCGGDDFDEISTLVGMRMAPHNVVSLLPSHASP